MHGRPKIAEGSMTFLEHLDAMIVMHETLGRSAIDAGVLPAGEGSAAHADPARQLGHQLEAVVVHRRPEGRQLHAPGEALPFRDGTDGAFAARNGRK